MAGSANQQNYGIQVQHLEIVGQTVVPIVPQAYQQGLWLEYVSGPTLAYVGGSSLAPGGTFGFRIPSGGANQYLQFNDYRGGINVVGSTTTATAIKVIRFFSANV